MLADPFLSSISCAIRARTARKWGRDGLVRVGRERPGQAALRLIGAGRQQWPKRLPKLRTRVRFPSLALEIAQLWPRSNTV